MNDKPSTYKEPTPAEKREQAGALPVSGDFAPELHHGAEFTAQRARPHETRRPR